MLDFTFYLKSLGAEATASFKAAFDMIDINGDGAICINELSNLVEKTGAVLSPEELQEMVNQFIQYSNHLLQLN